MPMKAMLSKGDKLMLAYDQTLVEIEVLMVGEKRTQLSVSAPQEIKIARIESQENKAARHPRR